MAGNDIRTISAETLSILTNAEVIALNQDKLGIAGDVVRKEGLLLDRQVWAKKLSDGSYGVVLLNKGANKAEVTLRWQDIGLKAGEKCRVRDLWQHKDVGVFDGSFTGTCEAHGVIAVKLTRV